jgi:glycosyltransferase involved in cell wall biosynthesis
MPFHYDKDDYQQKIKTLNCCVIIPTYNNEGTLASVIKDVMEFTPNILVVNDGSTDSTAEILKRFPSVEIISYLPNKGKGYALRQGLKRATELGYRYAITIDSDGQHFANDIPLFIYKIIETPDSMLIGARNLRQDNMPKKNTFGNKFSNFWFRFQTNINLPDTQSGYRLYPLQIIKGTKYFTSKYEFEIEVMVKAAWKGINIEAVPIEVYYAEEGKRVSHFRPGKDFTRISILNTYLTFLALIWYKPKHIIKSMTIKNMKNFIKIHFFNEKESVMKKSVEVAFGVFMGIIPIWGYQFVTALILAHFMKMNKAIVGLAANISVPPMIPFLLYGSLKTGQFVLGRDLGDNIFNKTLTLETIKQQLFEYIIGSMVFAVIMAFLMGLLCFIVLKLIGNKISSSTVKE